MSRPHTCTGLSLSLGAGMLTWGISPFPSLQVIGKLSRVEVPSLVSREGSRGLGMQRSSVIMGYCTITQSHIESIANRRPTRYLSQAAACSSAAAIAGGASCEATSHSGRQQTLPLQSPQTDCGHQFLHNLRESLSLRTFRARHHRRLPHIRIVADLRMQWDIPEQSNAHLFAFVSRTYNIINTGIFRADVIENSLPSRPKISWLCPQLLQVKVLMFCTMPMIGTSTFLKRSTPRTASRSARS